MSKWLLLIPTEFELKQMESQLTELVSACSIQTILYEVCGFGPVTSAARTSQLLDKHSPDHVLLLGIAGAYSVPDGLTPEVGTACQFNTVACYGIGVGSGKAFQTAEQMGWSQSVGDVTIENPIPLSRVRVSKPDFDDETPCQLLTVCAASSNPVDVQHRTAAFPNAVAEDMEGFSVAAACQMHNVELAIIRGISNVAGDRDKSNWQIETALKSALELSRKIIVSELGSMEANGHD